MSVEAPELDMTWTRDVIRQEYHCTFRFDAEMLMRVREREEFEGLVDRMFAAMRQTILAEWEIAHGEK